jgi:transposase
MDVSKVPLDVALRPTEDRWPVSNDEPGMAPLGACWRTMPPTLSVLEAPGGREVPVAGALAAAARPVVVVHPRPARDVAQATGRLATTDPLDAQGLAHVAEAVRPLPRPLPAAHAHALRALRTRRRPVGQRLTAARRRRPSAPRRIRADIQAPIAWLERRLARTDDDLAAAIRSSPLWRATDARRQRTPGVGPGLSRTLVADGPEWGLWHRQELAAWIGVAPCTDDRGTLRGQRAVWGGRAPVRAVRSMSPLAAVRHHPVLKACDARLRAVGNAPNVALTACMRQLWTMPNAMLNQRTPWREHDASHA